MLVNVILKRYYRDYCEDNETFLIGIATTRVYEMIQADLDDMEAHQLLVDRDNHKTFVSSDGSFQEITYRKEINLKMDEVNKLECDYVEYYILTCELDRLEGINF